jgi:hypothetical protein
VEELQMDWLMSEDLKEMKVMTTSLCTVTHQKVICLPQIGLASGRDITDYWQKDNHETVGQSDTRRSHEGKDEKLRVAGFKRENTHILGNEVLVVKHDVEK